MSTSAQERWVGIQGILGTKQDGIPGPKDQAVLDALREAALKEYRASRTVHYVKASSFADAADVAAFKRCKAQGKSDDECFAVGDNGVGFTGMNCATEDVCICALPREYWMEKWGSAKEATGKKVAVTHNGKTVIGVLGDTMPSRENIRNSAGIDLNPGFAKAFGITPPFMVNVTWQWV